MRNDLLCNSARMRLTLVHSMRFAAVGAVGAPGSIVTHALVVIQAGIVYAKLSGSVGQRGCHVQADVQTSRFQLLGRMKIASDSRSERRRLRTSVFGPGHCGQSTIPTSRQRLLFFDPHDRRTLRVKCPDEIPKIRGDFADVIPSRSPLALAAL